MTIASLYKYGKLGEHSESLFTTPTIWFSSPVGLNDPFECRPWFTFDGTEVEVLSVFSRIVRRNAPELADDQVRARSIEMQKRHSNKDDSFWDRFREQVAQMIANHIGLCCLTTSNENILMWSHYANDHQGFCVEFQATDTTPFFGEAQRVNYEKSFPTVDFFRTSPENQVDLMFLTKYSGWSYESEYRIVDHQGGVGLHAYPIELLKSVTFGLRTPEKDRLQIREWLARRQTKVVIYQSQIDQRNFKITAREAR